MTQVMRRLRSRACLPLMLPRMAQQRLSARQLAGPQQEMRFPTSTQLAMTQAQGKHIPRPCVATPGWKARMSHGWEVRGLRA